MSPRRIARQLGAELQRPRIIEAVDDLTRDLGAYDRAFGLDGKVM